MACHGRAVPLPPRCQSPRCVIADACAGRACHAQREQPWSRLGCCDKAQERTRTMRRACGWHSTGGMRGLGLRRVIRRGLGVSAEDGSSRRGEIAELVAVVAEYEPIEVIVGFPRSLSGGEGPAAAKARERAKRLAGATRCRSGWWTSGSRPLRHRSGSTRVESGPRSNGS